MSILAPDADSEDSARLAEELWQTVFDDPHIGVAIFGPDRRFLETNERFRELVGYTQAELRRLTVIEITHPADRPAHVKTADLLRTGKARDVQLETRYVRKDGGIVWVRVTAILAPGPERRRNTIALVEDVTERKAVEERLEKQDSLFREAQRIAHFGTWEWDPVADVAVWSDELYRILGMDPGSPLPDLATYLTWVLPDDREFVRSTLEGAIAGGTNIEYDTRIMRPDGRTGIIRIYGVPVFDGNGAVTRVVGVTQDITERRQAELEALEKEQRLRLAFDQMGAVLWTTDCELRLTSAHGAGLQSLGPHPEDVVGTPIADYFFSPNSTEVEAHRRALAGEHAKYEMIRGGRAFQVHVDPLRDEEATVVGVIGIAVDISEQRRAEVLLRDSEARYRLLFESNPSPMWVYDAETFAFLAVNHAAVRHYGYSREEFLSMKATEIRPPEEVPRWLEHVGKKTDVYGEGVWRHRKKDGTEIATEVMARTVDFAGRPARLVLVRDITDRRRAEERLARSAREMQALSARLQTIREEEDARVAREVHDGIGQALTALGLDVAWLANNLNRKGAREKFAGKLCTMAKLIETTTESVERIAADLRPGILDEVGLGAATEWAVRQFQDRTGVDCRFESNVNDESFDLERETAIFRILQEALTNVARHARARHVEVRLWAEGGRLNLEVRDDGAGIDPARISDSRSFGLLGMRERARALYGNVVIASRPEGGTLVTAAIPPRGGPSSTEDDHDGKDVDAADPGRR
ncbi:MAG TPA: PAS domain S-box protein [Thermoanaerobaculia bacterium]|nr:PAS domain S-box protein [Thermoanaerobaculia bacterium]